MKFLHLLLATAFLATPAARAAENRYDILGKLLAPFINVLAKNTKNPNRAMALTAKLERLTGAPAEVLGTTVELALQYPDRLLIHGPILGEDLTVCRDRQQVWVTPSAKVKALLELATAQKKLPKPDPAAQLEPFQLPVPEKQLVFLPVLFKVADAGSETVDGEDCRVLDVGLMPELEKSLKDKGWSARVWVRPNYRPARLVLTRPGWELALKFDKVEFAPKLPETTWQAPAEDVLTLDAPRFRQLMQAIVK
ncbi:MAG: hypothetical protein WCF18_01040 [Chthoniobacteraceae bacterium]